MDEQRRQLADVRARAQSAWPRRASHGVRRRPPLGGPAVEPEPFREIGYRRLMEAHVAAGNRGEALRVYERCRRLLAEELGAYPSPETESIYRSLLEAPSGRAAAVAPDSPSPAGAALQLPEGAAGVRPSRLLRSSCSFAVAAAIAIVMRRGVTARESHLPTVSARPRVALGVLSSSPALERHSLLGPVPRRARSRANSGRRRHGALGSNSLAAALERRTEAHRQVRPRAPRGPVRPGSAFVHEFKRLTPNTRFVVVDPDPVNGPLYTAVSNNPNASDVFSREGPGARLAGFLGAGMAERNRSEKRPVVLSEILINPNR